jgi:hypothetical protein
LLISNNDLSVQVRGPSSTGYAIGSLYTFSNTARPNASDNTGVVPLNRHCHPPPSNTGRVKPARLRSGLRTRTPKRSCGYTGSATGCNTLVNYLIAVESLPWPPGLPLTTTPSRSTIDSLNTRVPFSHRYVPARSASAPSCSNIRCLRWRYPSAPVAKH